jgi:hypothetical protein
MGPLTQILSRILDHIFSPGLRLRFPVIYRVRNKLELDFEIGRFRRVQNLGFNIIIKAFEFLPFISHIPSSGIPDISSGLSTSRL